MDIPKQILLIHGMWSNETIMHQLMHPLTSAGYYPVRVTLPHHESKAPNIEALALCGITHYIQRLYTELNTVAGPVTLIGHSLGGLIALACSDHRNVHRTVAVNPAPSFPCAFRNPFVMWAMLKRPHYFWHIMNKRPLKIHADDAKNLMLQRCTTSDHHKMHYEYYESGRAIFDILFRPTQLPRVPKQHIISSEHDRMTLPSCHKQMADYLGITPTVCVGGDHTSPLLLEKHQEYILRLVSLT